jgi:hypothetical protein
MTQLFCISAETCARFTRSQRQWITGHVQASTFEGVLVDLEQMNIDELYNLDHILAWVEQYWREQHAEPTSETARSMGTSA